ncbi:endonuclease [Tenacibaculum insulae]|uniref:endonuclease n=1 Tax=Tenacibaculum insulae TaxID=2029677 RepID=UPI003AB8FEF7
MMKRVLILGFIAVFLANCGQNGITDEDNIVPQEPVDKVLAVDDSYEVVENTPLVISDFLSNDTFTANSVTVGLPSDMIDNGTIALNDNKFTYTPAASFVGTTSFNYTICSTIATETCSTATVTIKVKASGNTTNGDLNIPAELAAYYNDVDFTLTGLELKGALATKIISSHATSLTYTPGVWEAVKKSDLDPSDNNKVLLIYGYDDSDGDHVTDRSRSKTANGGNEGTEWNREHVYPKSLGNPNLGTSGPGSDAHHLRPCDIRANSNRSNKKFIDGSGNAAAISSGWYPGDEWKGDVARMMMYMYLRYGNQCLPKNVTIGSENTVDSNMIDLLLQWNVQDPVSDFEKNRNDVIADEQGNRNPIIDNPYLATIIWGGSAADNTWE